MREIRVGDRVRALRSSGDHGGAYEIGKIYKIVGVDIGWVKTIDESNGERNGWYADNFELVTEESHEELFELMKKGFIARDKLVNDGVLQNFSPINNKWVSHKGCLQNEFDKEYRLKPKKEFKPFRTSNGWGVVLIDNELHIGCREYDKEQFKIALLNLLNNHSSSCKQKDYKFEATRTGIKEDGKILLWEDAEKILNALNEYESEK